MFSFVTSVVLLALFRISPLVQSWKITPLHNGIIFEKGSSVVSTDLSWTLILDYNMTLLQDQNQQLRMSFELLMETLSSNLTFDNELVHTISHSLMVAYTAMHHEYSELMDRLPRTTNREKRSLLDVGGKVLKTLFGTATESDLKKLHSQITKLEHVNNNLQISATRQILLVKNLETAIGNQSLAIQRLANASMGKIAEMQAILNDHVQGVDELFIKQIHNDHLLQHLAVTITSIRMELVKLRIALAQAANNKLSDVLINPNLYLQYLQVIQKRLNGNVHMIFPCTHEYLPDYYQIVDVSVVLMGQNLRILIKIPLASSPFILERYSLHVFPVLWNETNHYISWQVHNTLLISQDHRSYALLHKDDLSRCKVASILICPSFPLHDRGMPSCETSIFFSDTFLDTCQREILSLSKPHFIRLKTNWIYTMTHPITVTVTCPTDPLNFSTNKIVLSGSGILENATNCKIVSEDFTLPIMPEADLHVNLTFPAYHIPSFKDSIYHSEKLHILNQTDPTLLMNEINKYLQSSNNAIKYNQVLAQMETQLHASSRHRTVVATTSVTSILGIVVVIFVLFYLYRRYLSRVSQYSLHNAVPTATQIVVSLPKSHENTDISEPAVTHA